MDTSVHIMNTYGWILVITYVLKLAKLPVITNLTGSEKIAMTNHKSLQTRSFI